MLDKIPAELIHLICDYLFAKWDTKGLGRLCNSNGVIKDIVYGTHAYQIFNIIRKRCLEPSDNSSEIEYILYTCQNHIDRLKYLKYYCRFHMGNYGHVFHVACKFNQFDVVHWLNKMCVRSSINSYSYYWQFLNAACIFNHLDIARSLHATYKHAVISNTIITGIFWVVCGKGHLDMAKWLYDTYKLQLHNGEHALSFANEYGHLEVAEWLCDTFNI